MKEYSPWGQIDDAVIIIPGIDLVSTPSHGGARVSHDAAMLLSPEARKCSCWDGGYLWFEEECCEQVVLRELMDKKLWSPPAHRITELSAYEKEINRAIREYHPDYWKAREKRLNAPPPKAQQHRHVR